MRSRVEALLPATRGLGIRRCWAATIDFTLDHLPIIGPVLRDDSPVEGGWLAAAGGHGMMWGPAIAQAVADMCVTGHTDVVDVTDLGLSRFDASGRSSLDPDPIALPFPERTIA
jgi:sarcosine oxidase, subunit beta